MTAAIITVALVLAGIVSALTALGYSYANEKAKRVDAERSAKSMEQSAAFERARVKEKDVEITKLKIARKTAEAKLAEVQREALAGASSRRILAVIAGVSDADGGGGASRPGADAVSGEIVPGTPSSGAGLVDGDLR